MEALFSMMEVTICHSSKSI